MYQKIRLDAIMDILKKQGYVTVKQLMLELHYSSATINRDLNILEKQKLIKRSYGGAELIKNRGVALPYRYHKMKTEKRLIGHTAASFVNAGDTIFLDASTTTQSMIQYLTEKDGITVITNNMSAVMYLSEYGVNVICLGGHIQEVPSMLNGEETVMNAAIHHADKMFFSTGGVSEDGIIRGSAYLLLHNVMAKNSDKVFYLADHDKLNVPSSKFLFDFSKTDYVISDHDFCAETKANYPNTQFIYVGK